MTAVGSQPTQTSTYGTGNTIPKLPIPQRSHFIVPILLSLIGSANSQTAEAQDVSILQLTTLPGYDRDISKVLDFSINSGQFIAVLKPDIDYKPSRFNLMNGVSDIRKDGFGNLMLDMSAYKADGSELMQVHVDFYRQNLNICLTKNNGIKAELIQYRRSEDNPQFTLQISNASKVNNVLQSFDTIANISCNSIEELREQHPAHFILYVRPMLERLGQGKLCEISDATIASLFPDRILGAAELLKTFAQNIAALDDDAWISRRQAVERLVACGYEAGLYARKYPRANLTCEQIGNLEDVTRQFPFLSVQEASKQRTNIFFLMDCFLSTKDDELKRLIAKELNNCKTESSQNFVAEVQPDKAAVEVLIPIPLEIAHLKDPNMPGLFQNNGVELIAAPRPLESISSEFKIPPPAVAKKNTQADAAISQLVNGEIAKFSDASSTVNNLIDARNTVARALLPVERQR